MLLSCIGGILAGFVTAARLIHPTVVVVTKIAVYDLKVTQLIGGPTYTPYPTYTPIPPKPTPTVFVLALLPSPNFTPATLPAPSLTPTPLVIQLVAVSWNVYAGDEAFIKVRTLPGEKCTITFQDSANKSPLRPGWSPCSLMQAGSVHGSGRSIRRSNPAPPLSGSRLQE